MDIKEPREDRRKDPIPGEYGNPIPKDLFYREIGFGSLSAFHCYPRHSAGRKVVSQSLATKAVHTLCTKELTRRRFKLPNGARTTFHIAFSADGTKVASCHGDHNVYVCDVSSGEVIQTLSGHPRTPWCVVFHPSQNDILASGCLAGHVRVWDLKGGSELLVTDSGTVIASLAFHPTVRLLAIATFNEIIFWDWGHPYPLARCSTENTKEKVRLVRFDRLGRNLITGITNFPSPPSREDVRRSVRGGGNGGPIFRPNILSRNARGRRPPQTFTSSLRDDVEATEDVAMVSESEVVEEVVVPDAEVETEAEAFAVAAAAAAAADEDPLIVGETLNARQDRFQESYRQLVSHYEELVSNYQQFLQSRIPRILETSSSSQDQHAHSLNEPVASLELPNQDIEDNQMEDSYEADGLASNSNESVEAAVATILDSPSSPVVMDDEVPGPSRLLFEATQLTPVDNVGDSTPITSNQTSSVDTASTPTGRTGARSDTELRSIEALAQNILEMQNLCSQVRMDAPLAVENQHIMELRVIRRHLELLQEQTRDLQSSIRATLNSLATGSLAALRSHVANAANTNHNHESRESLPNPFSSLDQPSSTPGSSNEELVNRSPPLSPAHRASSQSTEGSSAALDTPRRIRIESTPSTSRSSSATVNSNGGPSTLYRIMITTPSSFSESGRGPSPHMLNRIRVPPMVAMQYEIADPYARNQPSTSTARSSDDPVPGPSREANSSNGRGREASGPRRIVREFHLVSGRPGNFLAEDHARHCPFSGRDPYHWRPPPRMRSLYDMGEMPALISWPTMETGLDTSIRNFREVAAPLRQIRSPVSSLTITVRNAFGNSGTSANDSSLNNSSPRNAPFMNFSQWLATSGINVGNLTSDVLVGIYLTIRQLSGNSNTSDVNLQSEQWQQVFGNIVPGLALIPPSLRQGQRQTHRCQHRRRRSHWICYNHSTSGHTSRHSHGRNSISNVSDDSSRTPTPISSVAGPSSNSIRNNSGNRSSTVTEESGHCSSSTSSSGGEQSSGSKNNASTSSTGKPIPTQLERNFTRVFYIRATDELIPVYSTVHSSETVLGTEVRESLQASVYYLPIGLFLQGGPWETNTQTVGIHWPPVTREEEYAVLDLRVSERPLTVYQSETRESFPNRRYPRIRLDYDQTSLRVTLPTGFSLHFIQSGLTLLDCISTSVNLPRPRSIEGTLWVDYLGPFLDALERMFGLRHSRRPMGSIPSSHRVGAFLGRTPPWVHAGNVRPSLFSNSPPSTSANSGESSNSRQPSSSNSNNNNNSNSGSVSSIASASRERLPVSSRRADVSERLRTMTRRIITLAPDANVDSGRRRFYEDNPMLLSHGYMYGNDNSGNNGGTGGYRSYLDRNDRRLSMAQLRHRFRPDHTHNSGSPQGMEGRENPDGRFIRFAVDTAATELLRRNQQHLENLIESNNGLPVVEAGSASGLSGIGRPVESRIERVLNERGNRGSHSPSPPGLSDERNRIRLEEFQMRISMLSQWSRARAMATSGTQTPHSFVRGAWPPSERPSQSGNNSERERLRGSEQQLPSTGVPSTSASSTGGNNVSEPRLARRRPYSRIARVVPTDGDDNSDEDILISVPARVPRLNDQNSTETERSRNERPDASNGSGRGSSVRHHIDHWVFRSSPASSVVHRYRPSNAVELSGSARTRAPPQNRFSADTADSSSGDSNEADGVRPRFNRIIRNGAANSTIGGSVASNDGNNNNVGNGNEEQHLDAGARFYPGYIPEILITPRTRPPTYYTMDAATTAFLSSRIQKWDFSKFLIPDITKRDEFVVVRECSLHSDACLDVSVDSEFLAVLQPSDNGSYSSVGIYSLRDDCLGEILNVYHFDQNTVSVSISPSCDYMVVGYAGRGPLYRFVHPSRNIGKILSLTRDEEKIKLVSVKDLYADGQVAFMSINCMHWVPVAGYGIIYGTNTGDLVLLS